MTNAEKEKTILLGEDYDKKLRAVVLETIRDLGANGPDHSWTVGGSQEVESLQIMLDGNTIIIDAETFVGLSSLERRSS